jgi:hypothetical protein
VLSALDSVGLVARGFEDDGGETVIGNVVGTKTRFNPLRLTRVTSDSLIMPDMLAQIGCVLVRT